VKKLLPILVLILIGCSEPEPEPLNYELLERRDGVHYRKDTNEIYSGPVFNIDGSTTGGKSEGTLKEGKFYGTLKFYYWDGELKEEVITKNGLQVKSKLYYHNGRQEFTLKEYKDGSIKYHGPWIKYFKNGQLWGEGTFKDGELISKKEFDYYYDTGKLYEEKTYKDGELISKKEFDYYDNGQLKSEKTYKNGELIESKEY
jgi:antitoxin component YwqK of YwqJK toxin-antitoxin module